MRCVDVGSSPPMLGEEAAVLPGPSCPTGHAALPAACREQDTARLGQGLRPPEVFPVGGS